MRRWVFFYGWSWVIWFVLKTNALFGLIYIYIYIYIGASPQPVTVTTIVGRITKNCTYKMCVCFFSRLVKLYVIFPIVFYNIPVVIGDVMSELRQQRLMRMRRMRSQSLLKFRQYLTKKTRRNYQAKTYQRLRLQQHFNLEGSKVGLFFGTTHISFLGSMGGKQTLKFFFWQQKYQAWESPWWYSNND